MPRLNFHLRGFIAGVRDGHGPLTGHSGALNTLGLRLHEVGGYLRSFAAGWSVLNGADPAGSLDRVGQAGVTAHIWLGRLRDAAGQVKDKIAGLFPVDAAGAPSFSAALDRVKDTASELWPLIRQGASQISGVRPIVTVTGAVFGFLADHIDTIIKYMPLLIGAFVAYKTVQSLSNIISLASIPIRIAELAVTWASASANRALAFQLQLLTGVQQRGRVATLASMIASAAHRVATLAMSAATRAAAAGQWLLNAAMSANPIGLVVLAVAALAIGFVVLWKKSETFRGIVIGVFKAVAGAALTMVDTVLSLYQRMFDAMGKLPGKLGAPFRAASEGIQKVRDKVGGLQNSLNELGQTTVRPTVAINMTGATGAAGNAARAAVGGKLARLDAKARGGLVRAGQPYLVGEDGQEMFSPSVNGRIIPAQRTEQLMASRPFTLPDRDGAVAVAPRPAPVVNVTIHESADPRRTLQLVRQAVMDAQADE